MHSGKQQALEHLMKKTISDHQRASEAITSRAVGRWEGSAFIIHRMRAAWLGKAALKLCGGPSRRRSANAITRSIAVSK